ncbi:hypothetical protein GYA49_06425 [Candidatus Beckwithbacteria bacterium]|nr:hypothetical protein [Candidatus Beckwithbacteria bacterium]
MPIRLPRETVESWLRECPEDQAFVCINGQRTRTIKDLVKIFERMTIEDYRYHVGKDKNDFAAWAEGVFHNGHLAANFRSARSLKEAYQYVKRHQEMLERNLRDFTIRDQKRARRRS